MNLNLHQKPFISKLLAVVFMSVASFAVQAQSDNCATATNLGAITAPACVSGSNVTQTGTLQTFTNQSNVSATVSNPFVYQGGCSAGINTPQISRDVWYTFTVNGNFLNTTVTSTFANPSVAIWEGSCGNLVGRGCANGTGGTVSTNFTGLIPGNTYLLQVGGGDQTQVGTFTMTLQAGRICETCLRNYSLTASPAKSVYAQGEVVTFTLTVNGWDKRGYDVNTGSDGEWFSGIEIDEIGPAWLSTITPVTTPASCDQIGQWLFLANGGTPFTVPGAGPGFYYDSYTPGLSLDNNPFNNFGDGASCDYAGYYPFLSNNAGGSVIAPAGHGFDCTPGNYGCGDGAGTNNTWTFSWQMTVGTCPPLADGNDLRLLVNTRSMAETNNPPPGFPNTGNCGSDPVLRFNASITCCNAPTLVTSNPTCSGASDGSVVATADLSVAGTYTYILYTQTGFNSNTPLSTQAGLSGAATFSSLSAGDYVVKATCSGNGCTRINAFSLINPASFTLTTTSQAATCNGLSNGTVTTSVVGGGTFTYAWSGTTQTTSAITGLAAGNYTVTVTQSGGCSQVTTTTVSQPAAPLAVTVSTTTVSCNGGSNGTATANATGTQGGTLTYLWSTGATTATLTNRSQGLVSVTVTETGTNADGRAYSCSATGSATVPQPAVLAATSITNTEVSCNGGSNGTATVNITGGTTPYTYLWSASASNQTTQTATGLSTANNPYSVIVTDANGCTVNGGSTTLSEPAGISFALLPTNPTCFGTGTGLVDLINLSGGTPGTSPAYTYVWTGPAGFNSTSEDITGLIGSSTPYSVTVTDSRGCTGSGSVTLANPPLLSASIPAGNITNVTCNGSLNGQIIVNVSGGTGTRTYSWTGTAQTTQTVTGLSGGNYTVLVTDQRGCTATANTFVSEPSLLAVTLNPSLFNGVNITCASSTNGSIGTVVTGGNGTYNFNWGGGITTQNRSGLTAGVYTVSVTDILGCSATASSTLVAPTQVTASILSSTNPTCNGGANGSINLNVTGGTLTGGQPDYTYVWTPSPAAGQGQDPINLTAQTYNVVASDANGCTATATATLVNPAVVSLAITNVGSETCLGSCNATATVAGSGGVGSFGYIWSNGQTTATATGLCSANTYAATVTDGSGCSAAVTNIQPGAPAALTVNAVVTSDFNGRQISCSGSTNGVITATAAGGNGGYAYSWSNTAQTTSVITGIGVGTYNVTVTDAQGCSVTASTFITPPPTLSASVVVTALPQCNNDLTGSLDLTVQGGTVNYTYSWSNGMTAEDVSGLGDNTYFVTVTDVNGCSTTASEVITEPAALVVNVLTATPVSCNGSADGAITLGVSGGTGIPANFTYTWNPTATGQNPTNLAAAVYNVTVTDQQSCTATATTTITEPTALTGTFTVVNPLCFGLNTGQATITPSGGTGTYTFLWSDGQTTQTATGLAAGSYFVDIFDASGCGITINNVDINAPTSLLVNASSTPTFCNGGNDGTATAVATDGTGPTYSYLWSDGQITATATGLSPGAYNVTAYDSNGCSATGSTIVAEPAGLLVDAGYNITLNVSQNGTIGGAPTVQGGSAPYTYSWSNGETTSNPVVFFPAPGQYPLGVTVTDNSGCSASDQVIVTVQCLATFVSNAIIDNASCGEANGAITLTVGSATSSYNFNWSAGTQSGNGVTDLAAGNYTVTITENGTGCFIVENYAVGNFDANFIISMTQSPAACGSNNGSATANVSTSVAAPQYNWSNGDNTASITNVAPGEYFVTVTDPTTGCVDVASIVVEQGGTFVASVSAVTPATCGQADGSATINVTGPFNGVLSFAWSDNPANTNFNIRNNLEAGVYNVVVTDGNGCQDDVTFTIENATPPVGSILINNIINETCPGQNNGYIDLAFNYTGTATPTSVIITNGLTVGTNGSLAPGNWCVNLLDATGCIVASSCLDILPAGTMEVVVDEITVVCHGAATGGANLTVTGGAGGYTYIVGGVNNGTSTINTLSAGLHTIVVADQNGCNVVGSFSLDEPAALAGGITIVDNLCFNDCNGSATSNPSGGTAPYTYLWSNGATTAINTGLCAGNYQITLTDAVGCVATNSIFVGQPAQIALSPAVTDLSCNGGSNGAITMSVSGGTAPYTYLWDNGDTNGTIAGLTVGNYDITVTDANACTSTLTVTVNEPTPITITVDNITNLTCFGGSNGSIDITVIGGTPLAGGTYNYSWNGGVYVTQDLANIPAGVYDLVVFDQNTCTATASITVTAPSSVSVTAASINPTCNIANGPANGQINLAILGGAGTPYNVVWSANAGIQTGPSIINLAEGNYGYTVTDAGACPTTGVVTLTSPAPITATFNNVVPVLCYGGTDGRATVTASGSTGNQFNFTWSSLETGTGFIHTAVALPAGAATVTIVEQVTGCQLVASVPIPGPIAPMTLGNGYASTSPICNGDANGSISVTPTGGTPPYVFVWSDASGATINTEVAVLTSSITGLAVGSYGLVVTDANNCPGLNLPNLVLTEPDTFTIDSITTTDVSCFGGHNGTATLQAVSNGTPSLIAWSNNQFGVSVDDLTAGSYTVTVTSTVGCTATSAFNINEPASAVLIPDVTADTVTCYGDADGTITIDTTGAGVGALGGTPDYTFSVDGITYTDQAVFPLLPSDYYWVYVQDALGCLDSTEVYIGTPQEVDIRLSPDFIQLDLGDSSSTQVQLMFTPEYLPLTYTWTPSSALSCSDCDNPNVKPYDDENFNVTVTDAHGCSDVATLVVDVKPNRYYYIPTAFTPNGDLSNDIFTVYGGLGVDKVQTMKVYDRWGELLYQADDFYPDGQSKGWDGTHKGKPMQTGVFVYYVEIRFMDGNVKAVKGDVTLIK